MKKTLLAVGLLGAFVLVAPAATVIDVGFGQAPNVFGSPTYQQWTQNGIASLRSGLPAGTPNTPAYFQTLANFTPEMLVVSTQHSWDAQVNPGVVFGPAYSSEFGSRMALVTYIFDTTGAQFDIATGIAVHRDASPWRSPALDLTYNTYGTQGGVPTLPTRVGINWGLDGLP